MPLQLTSAPRIRISVPSVRSERKAAKSAGRVLVVDDSSDGRWMISSILKCLGLQVTVAENAKTGCQTALAAQKRGEGFDLVLMDAQMPEMDGYQATASLRQSKYPGRIVAMISPCSFDLPDSRWQAAGCDGHARKPISFEMLQRVVQQHLPRCARAVD